MYDFLSEHALYIVLAIVLICWFGIFVYLYSLDRKISRIEKQIGNLS